MVAQRYNSDCSEARAALAHKVGASRLYMLACVGDDALDRIAERLKPMPLQVCKPLDGMPVACTDIKTVGQACRERGEVLFVDDTLPGPYCCDALRLGAQVMVVNLDDMLSMVALSRDAHELAGPVEEALSDLAQADDAAVTRAIELLDTQAQQWRRTSDAAQVIASYLRCHPKVDEVRYPGLRGDASYEVAARTLIRGFGPLVDYRSDGAWQRYCATTRGARDQVLALERRLSGLASLA